MSMDPYSGMYEDPGALGSAASMNAQAGMPGLPMQMLNASPGLIASMGYSSFRGRNTLLKGGSRPDLFRTTPVKDDFFALGFTKSQRMARREAKVAAGKTPFFRRALQQRNPLQFTDLSIFSGNAYGMEGVRGGGLYTPFGAAGFLGNTGVGQRIGKRLTGIELKAGEKGFGPGLFAFMGAGTKIDRLEAKAAAGGRSGRRAAAKLGRVDENISTLIKMNNPGMMANRATSQQLMDLARMGGTPAPVGGTTVGAGASRAAAPNTAARLAEARRVLGPSASRQEVMAYARTMAGSGARVRAGTTVVGPGGSRAAAPNTAQRMNAAREFFDQNPSYGLRASVYDEAMGLARSGQVGVRGNLMASTAAGGFTQYTLGYARGALGFGGEKGLFGRALQGAQSAEKGFKTAFKTAFGDAGFTTLKSNTFVKGTEEAAEAFLRSTGGKAFFRELGVKGVGKLAASGGAKMLAMRGAALAIPGLQPLAAVMFMYDIGRMIGAGIKGGIDFARDAGVSLRGTIDKPAFGMGYKDTEAAATSRARGVMAIQNSRLNMRSLLGSEAGMMAAHYG